MSRASATPPVPSEGAAPTSQRAGSLARAGHDSRTVRPAARLKARLLPHFALGGYKAAEWKQRSRGLVRNRGLRSPPFAARGRRWAPPALDERVRSASKHYQGGVPAGWPGARRSGWGVTGPATSETLPAARPQPHTHQDPLEERVLLGREAHGRHGSGSSRGSRHRPARSVRLSARRHCRS